MAASVTALLEKVEQANRVITLIEELRERLVHVIGHNCPKCDLPHSEEADGD